MKRYFGQAVPELAALLGEDVCTFSMLSRIVGGRCTKTVTDHRRVIMCLSVRPFPVWVWTAPDADRAELEGVWEALRAEFPPEEGYAYNVRLPLARVILEGDPSMREQLGLMAYHCHETIPPRKTPGGGVSLVGEDEVDRAAAWFRLMDAECVLHEDIPLENAKEVIRDYVSRRSMFFWLDENGEPKSICGVDEDENAAHVTHVYTPPRERRKGYAANLVYTVSKAQLDAGRVPMLYTDANYSASNGCYTQIGFALQGELRTVARK